jgi:hypothetical protein
MHSHMASTRFMSKNVETCFLRLLKNSHLLKGASSMA